MLLRGHRGVGYPAVLSSSPPSRLQKQINGPLQRAIVKTRICCQHMDQHNNKVQAKSQASLKMQKLTRKLQEHTLGAAVMGIAAMIVRLLRQATPKEMQVASASPVGGAMRTFKMATIVAPFASLGIGGTGFLVTKAVGSFLQTYLLLLFLRVLLSWFPAFNWERQPWLTLRQMTDPYLQLFRGLIPPLLGMIDFTPLLGFFILQWASGKLASATMEDSVEAFW